MNFKLILGAVVAIGLGTGALFGYASPGGRLWSRTESTSTPLTRVGYALGRPQHQDSRAYTELKDDVQAVRKTLTAQDQSLFDLVVATHGLGNTGRPEWARAERYCHALGFPRCDKEALLSLSGTAAVDSPAQDTVAP